MSLAIVPGPTCIGNGKLLDIVRIGEVSRACPSGTGFAQDHKFGRFWWLDQGDRGIQTTEFKDAVETLVYLKSALPTTICVVLD